MANMPGDRSPDLVTVGRRLRIKVLLALALAAGVPIVVLVAIVAASTPSRWLLALVALTLLAVSAGATILWHDGGTVARMARMLTSEHPPHEPQQARDEAGTLAGFFARMVGPPLGFVGVDVRLDLLGAGAERS